MVLGMIPDCDLDKVTAVGNAAGDGARMMLLDHKKRDEAAWAARWVHYVETAGEMEFQEEFVSAINFPHAVDPFPVAEGIIEGAGIQWPPERRSIVAGLRRWQIRRIAQTGGEAGMTKIAPYGSWASPISAEMVAGNARHMSQLVCGRGQRLLDRVSTPRRRSPGADAAGRVRRSERGVASGHERAHARA